MDWARGPGVALERRGGRKNENLLKNNYTLNRVGETSKTGEHFIGYEDLGENSDVVF